MIKLIHRDRLEKNMNATVKNAFKQGNQNIPIHARNGTLEHLLFWESPNTEMPVWKPKGSK